MKHHLRHSYIVLFALALFTNCNNNQVTLQEGDLLFQDLDCGPLCDAIETVTEGVNGRDFSHCGMVIKVKDSLRVIEAIGDGVQINTLETFLARSGDTQEIQNTVIARVKPSYTNLLTEAITYAKQQVGAPYDHEFILDNETWYCSELLYEAFKSANDNEDFFELAPMTYKDPKTNQFFPAWVDYYEDLKKDIPEGKPGLNPGSISRSNKLELLDINTL